MTAVHVLADRKPRAAIAERFMPGKKTAISCEMAVCITSVAEESSQSAFTS
ncbi:hypothetical protein [Dyella acidiphila]|uniref:Uncharacterized protein n=1 Tax=Dyella acidiphila TaxID=2775866 RepID=A0ABR9GEC3_9GAMM|nr:hypothetical protein [Dyella acidiphila]MBE1162407.1 hypothetical protein [Dyella acidiphila]